MSMKKSISLGFVAGACLLGLVALLSVPRPARAICNSPETKVLYDLTAAISGPDKVCLNDPATFTVAANGPIATWSWTGGGVPPSASTPSFITYWTTCGDKVVSVDITGTDTYPPEPPCAASDTHDVTVYGVTLDCWARCEECNPLIVTSTVTPASAGGVVWTHSFASASEGLEPFIATNEAETQLEITVLDGGASGVLTVTAKMVDAPECEATKYILIDPCGCADRGGSGCPAGGCQVGALTTWLDRGMGARFSLGRSNRGRQSSWLNIRAGSPTASLATPGALDIYGCSDDPIVIKQNGILRQVRVAEGLVDAVGTNDTSYDLRYYRNEDLESGRDANGLFQPKAGATPYVVYAIENPSGSTEDVDELWITRTVAGDSVLNKYEFLEDGNTTTWTLTKGNGLRVETETTVVNGTERVVTHEVKDGAARVASKKERTFDIVAGKERQKKEVDDPDGAALTREWSFYEDEEENGYGRVKDVQYPDRSWQRYEYDGSGRPSTTRYGRGDAAIDAPDSEIVVETYDYTSLLDGDTGEFNVASPRTITRTEKGHIVSRIFHAYTKDSNGRITQTTERAASATAAYGDSGNIMTVMSCNPVGNPEDPGCGLVDSLGGSDGRLDSYEYAFGTYTRNSDPALNAFTEGAGDHLRVTVTHGTANAPS